MFLWNQWRILKSKSRLTKLRKVNCEYPRVRIRAATKGGVIFPPPWGAIQSGWGGWLETPRIFSNFYFYRKNFVCGYPNTYRRPWMKLNGNHAGTICQIFLWIFFMQNCGCLLYEKFGLFVIWWSGGKMPTLMVRSRLSPFIDQNLNALWFDFLRILHLMHLVNADNTIAFASKYSKKKLLLVLNRYNQMTNCSDGPGLDLHLPITRLWMGTMSIHTDKSN